MTLAWVLKFNLSGITPANRNRSGPNLINMHRSRGDNVRKIMGWFCQVGVKQKALTTPAKPQSFFVRYSLPGGISSGWIFQRPIFTTFGESMSPRKVSEGFSKFYAWGHCPPNLKIEGYLTLTSLQPRGRTPHCREILFTPRCSPRAMELSEVW